jgi:DNA helicase-2/ATP-dependent DNA helicase PcrA
MGKPFTEQQTTIIKEDINSNFKVVAVPGSGKSTVLVYRIEYIMDQHVHPDNILVIMFNDDATINFRADLKEIDYIHLPKVKTYHSYAMYLGKQLAKHGYLSKQLTLVTDNIQYNNFYREILTKVLPINLQRKVNSKTKEVLDDFITFVELVKSTLTTPELIFKIHGYPLERISFIQGFYLSETDRLQSNKQFFSDLIFDVVSIARKHPECLPLISNKHKVILVDEYQDSNALCHELLKLIAGDRANINVVGDDDQTIYDFTGASPKFLIHKINEDFPQVKHFSLSKTFRYGHSVALLANNVIHNNENRMPKLSISARDDLYTQIATASYDANSIDCKQVQLIEQISQWVLNGGKFQDIAILIRNYQFTFGIEIALLRHGLPYFISKKNATVLHSKEATFIFSCVTLLSEKDTLTEDSIRSASHLYLSSFLWGVDKEVLNTVSACIFNEDKESLMDAFSKVKANFKPDVSRVITKRIKALIKTRNSKNRDSDYLIRRLIKESGLINSIKKFYWKNPLIANVKFKAIVDLFCSFDKEITQTGSIAYNLKLSNNNGDKLNKIEMTTLHKSKGLSWPLVVMAYCEENILPSVNAFRSSDLVEVERRLYFVGITRARNKLVLHIPNCPTFRLACSTYKGKMNKVDYFREGHVSRFVYESNILSATQIAYEIYKDKEGTGISQTENVDLYNEYLFKINKTYRISGLQSNDKQRSN